MVCLWGVWAQFHLKKSGGKAFVDHDEWKFMLGFKSKADAVSCYKKCMSDKLYGGVTTMSWASFKAMVTRNKNSQ